MLNTLSTAIQNVPQKYGAKREVKGRTGGDVSRFGPFVFKITVIKIKR